MKTTSKAVNAALLPPEAPLSVPVQDFFKRPRLSRVLSPLVTEPSDIIWRRVLVIGSALALTAYGTYNMNLVFNSVTISWLGLGMMVLFVLLFLWIALAFTSSCVGFFNMIFRQGKGELGIKYNGPLPVLLSRTAILMPCCNEDPMRVMANLRAIYRSLEINGCIQHFDFFILSDTNKPDIWIQEEQELLAFRRDTKGFDRIFYRRRTRNIGKKAGNLTEWVRRFGARYGQMLTLDADSIMDGGSIVRIVSAVEQNPSVGLVQSVPVVVNGSTLFARLQQFSGRLYGHMIAHGIAWWYGAESNYWGHNAIIRVQAFAEQAGLPHLKGRKPFGGLIMSHDFVEAALLRRGGWAVHMVPTMRGSYEESPPSLIDIAIRDRRWCQGNLQHLAVIGTCGFHWLSRMHMLIGIGAYITSPLWLLFLLTGILITFQSVDMKPEYFSSSPSLYPNWPQVDPVRAQWVFIGTMAVLLVPKLLAYIAMLFRNDECRRFGNPLLTGLSLLLETLLSGLLAPIAMLIHTSVIVAILCGKDSGWNAQRRDDRGYPFSKIVASYWLTTVFGMVLGLAVWNVSHSLFYWMTPITVGLTFSIPLIYYTGSRRVGRFFRDLNLLVIPEERTGIDILKWQWGEINKKINNEGRQHPLDAIIKDSALLHLHKMALPAERKKGEPIEAHLLVGLVKIAEADSLEDLKSQLTEKELLAILSSCDSIEKVRSLPYSARLDQKFQP